MLNAQVLLPCLVNPLAMQMSTYVDYLFLMAFALALIFSCLIVYKTLIINHGSSGFLEAQLCENSPTEVYVTKYGRDNVYWSPSHMTLN